MISILIPTENRPAYLARALGFYHRLGFAGTICVDDRSTPEHAATNRRVIASCEGQLHILYHGSQESDPVILSVPTPYLILARDDMFAIPSMCQECVKFLQAHPEYSSARGKRFGIVVQPDAVNGRVMGAYGLQGMRISPGGAQSMPALAPGQVYETAALVARYQGAQSAVTAQDGGAIAHVRFTAILGRPDTLEYITVLEQVHDASVVEGGQNRFVDLMKTAHPIYPEFRQACLAVHVPPLWEDAVAPELSRRAPAQRGGPAAADDRSLRLRAILNQARHELAAGQADLALARLDRMMDLVQETPDTLSECQYARSIALLCLGRIEEAISLSDDGLNLTDHQGTVRNLWAQSAVERQLDGLVGHARQASQEGQPDQVLAYLDKILQVSQVASYPVQGLQYARADELAKLGRIDEAIAAAQAELQVRPTFQPALDLLTRLSSAEVVIQRDLVAGQSALAAGDLAGALEAFTRVTQHDANLATGFMGLGSALMALGRHAEAVPALRRAIELAPEETSLQNQLGVALFQAGDLAQAVAVFQHVWQGDPDNVSAPLNLIDLYRAGGDYAAATAVVTQALSQHPGSCDILAAFGGLCLELGDAEGARLAMQRIEAREANHPAVAMLRQALGEP